MHRFEVNTDREVYSFASNRVVLDVNRHEFMIDGEQIYLMPRDFQFTKFLAQHAGSIISTNDIHDHMWPGGNVRDDKVANRHAYRLRTAIGSVSLAMADKSSGIVAKTSQGYGLHSEWPAPEIAVNQRDAVSFGNDLWSFDGYQGLLSYKDEVIVPRPQIAKLLTGLVTDLDMPIELQTVASRLFDTDWLHLTEKQLKNSGVAIAGLRKIIRSKDNAMSDSKKGILRTGLSPEGLITYQLLSKWNYKTT